MSDFPPSHHSNVLFAGFEPEDFATREDQCRLQRISAALMPHSTSASGSPWTRRIRDPIAAPAGVTFDRAKLAALHALLAAGLESECPQPTLASSVAMRTLRLAYVPACIAVIEASPATNFATFTVIRRQWELTPPQLERCEAAQLVNQFRTHLNRAGVLAISGPFVACLHGEYDPVRDVFILHFHGWTTAEKAAALHRLKAKRWGYEETASGARPIVVRPLRDPAEQLSYTAKAYWPQKGLRDHGDRQRRDRTGYRILEPWHLQHLLWLHRHQFKHLVLLNNVWSPRNGGSDEGRTLYLMVQRPFDHSRA